MLGWFNATLQFTFDHIADHLTFLVRQVFHLLSDSHGQTLGAFDFGFHLAHCPAQLRADRFQAQSVEHIVGNICCQPVSFGTGTETESAYFITTKNPAFGRTTHRLALAKTYGVSLPDRSAPFSNAFFSRFSNSLRRRSTFSDTLSDGGAIDFFADSSGFVFFVDNISQFLLQAFTFNNGYIFYCNQGGFAFTSGVIYREYLKRGIVAIVFLQFAYCFI